MIFALDASVTMCWLLNDGMAAARNYASQVLAAMGQADIRAVVPAI